MQHNRLQRVITRQTTTQVYTLQFCMCLYLFQCYKHQIRRVSLENLLNLQEQGKPQCIGSVHQDMMRRNVNLMFIDRSECCYVFRFLCI